MAQGKPVVFAVDDEPAVLAAVARDVRREFGERYRVLRAESGQAALEALRELKLREDPVALLLVDQRMPGMTGVELLARAVELFPAAKRALLTAYADTEAAIRGINEVRLDHYLRKPWDPPEEHLYPVMHELLDEWEAAYRPPFEGIRVVGHRWSAESHRVKDFLARHLVPYRWLDVESDPEARQLLEAAEGETTPLPLVSSTDGWWLARPSDGDLAEKIGLKTRATLPFYDLLIVGGGPAGLAAAVYGASEGLRTLLVESRAPGGQAGTSSRIENYLGFPTGISGAKLTEYAVFQAQRFGVEILTPVAVCGVLVDGPTRLVSLSNGSKVGCHALLIASGVSYRTLEAPGIERLTGAGVYYGAALTEAMACQELDVFVVGGGNSAGQGAMHLSKHARSVTVLIRGASLSSSMSQYLIDQLAAQPNIRVQPHSVVAEAHGDDHLEALTIADSRTGERQTVPAQALFIFIGAAPHTDWLPEIVERDKYGFILAGRDTMRDGRRPRGWTVDREPYWLETSVPGIFVAGDVRHQSVKRVASGVGEGAMAVQFVHQYLAGR